MLQQTGDLSALGAPQPAFGFAVGDIRLGARHAFLRGPIDLAGQIALELASGHHQALTGDQRMGGEALLSAPQRRGDREWSGNAFVRFRPPRDVGPVRLANEVGLRAVADWWLST